MWVQQLNKNPVSSRSDKLGTLEHVSDLLTRHVPPAVLDKLAGMMVYTFPDEETRKVSRGHEHQSEFLGSEIGSN